MNTRRMNRLEELGRVDSEKSFTKKGKRNLKDERKEFLSQRKLNKKKGSMAKGGKVLKPVDKEKNPCLAKLPTKVRNKMGYMKKGRVKMKSGGMAKKGMGCEIR